MRPASVAPPARSFAYPILLLLGAVDAVGYSVIAPVLPAIARASGAGPAAIGALVATFPVGMVIGFVPAGRQVARGRSRSVLLASLGLVAAGSLGFALSGTLALLFVFRFVMGLGSGGLWIGITFNTLERWPGQEYLCMSRVLAAYSVGGLIGPALGALGGIRAPFLAYLGIVAVGAAFLPLLGAPPERRRFATDRSALRQPGFRLASAGILYAVLGLGVAEGVLPLHLAERLSQGEIGVLYVGVSVVVAVAAAAAARFAPRLVLSAAILLIAAGLSLAGATAAFPLWVVALVLNGAGVGAGNTGSMGILLQAVPSERIVTAMVVWSQIAMLGYLAGPLLGGVVVQAAGFAALWVVPAAAGAALLAVMARSRPARSSS